MAGFFTNTLRTEPMVSSHPVYFRHSSSVHHLHGDGLCGGVGDYFGGVSVVWVPFSGAGKIQIASTPGLFRTVGCT